MKINDNFYMKLAVDEAWKYQLLTYPNPAVGAVVVKNGELLSIEAHKEAGKPHAEVNALKAAYLKYHPESRLKMLHDAYDIHEFLRKHSEDFFYDCTIYVTLEPCNHSGKTPSCAKLIKKLNLKKVVIGINDPNITASGGQETLEDANIEVETSVMRKACTDLLYPFMKWTQGTFIFYKMAQTINGCIDGQISSNQAKAYVHAIRDKIDCLAIGGNTVRTDRPTLDSRYIQGNNPDVFIYSKNKIFDKNIPLFNVPNRNVTISDDLFNLLDHKFVMVEGSYNLLNVLKERLDYIVLLVNPKIRKGLNALAEMDMDFEIIHENYIGQEKIVYLKKK